MTGEEYWPALAWYTHTPEQRNVFHTCWDCPMRREIEYDNLDVTITGRARRDLKRELCEQCETIAKADGCCKSYPCRQGLTAFAKALVNEDTDT